MAIRHLWQASLLTALLLLAPTVAAEESSNAEDEASHGESKGPCDPIVIALQEPYVDLHPECLPEPFS